MRHSQPAAADPPRLVRSFLLEVAEPAAKAERRGTNPVGCSRHGRCVWHRVDHIGKMAARRAHRVDLTYEPAGSRNISAIEDENAR